MSETILPEQQLAVPGVGMRPLVILTPTDLNIRSNGHACILTLATQLLKAGVQVHLLPYKPYTFYRRFYHRLPPAHRNLPFISDLAELPQVDLLVPESAPPKLVDRLRPTTNKIIWWLLAPAGLLTAFRPKILPGDYLLAFSEFTLPRQAGYLFIQPPPDPDMAHSAIKHLPQPPLLPQIALYTGKGRLRRIPKQLHRRLCSYPIVSITRSFPASRRSLIKLLEQSTGLISCDPLTNLTLEAAILGRPTFLVNNPFPSESYARFPATLTDYVTDSPDQYITWLQRTGRVRKLRTTEMMQKSATAAALVRSILEDEPTAKASPYRVTEQSLSEIRNYRHLLASSGTIQAIRDGQSISSLFLKLYLLSLKAPYRYHQILCIFLHVIDELGDALDRIGMLRPIFMAVNLMLSPLLTVRRFYKRIRRRYSNKSSQ